MPITIETLAHENVSGFMDNNQVVIMPRYQELGYGYTDAAILLLNDLKSNTNIPIRLLSDKPDSKIHCFSNNWIGPAFLIAHAIYSSNPDFFTLFLEALKMHLERLFPQNKMKNVKFQILIEETKTKTKIKTVKSIMYDGPAEGISSLEKEIEKLINTKEKS